MNGTFPFLCGVSWLSFFCSLAVEYGGTWYAPLVGGFALLVTILFLREQWLEERREEET